MIEYESYELRLRPKISPEIEKSVAGNINVKYRKHQKEIINWIFCSLNNSLVFTYLIKN